MDFLQIFILTVYMTQVVKTKSRSKKYKSSSSDEDSIENLLYYKDCQRQGKTEAPPKSAPMIYEARTPPPPPPQPRQPECPFPKMCCALTCGNECGVGGGGSIGGGGNYPSAGYMRHSEAFNNFQPIQSLQPMIQQPHQPGMGIQQQMIQRRKKKVKLPPPKIQAPPQTRRDFSGFTKEKIKGLIAQDNDIRKILKDLVTVTMQKVDLLDMINSNRKEDEDVTEMTSPAPVFNLEEYDE
uniref:SFRICE_032503 n=1 Tax=Spodoptera frugiperda TaxID=7108 RepID=A0A2H1VB84_SPOFR